MGQYYKPLVLHPTKNKVEGWMYSHDYGNGLKLMEHSYLANNFVRTVEAQLSPGGEWYKSRLVWGGDYADNEPGTETPLYSMCSDAKKIKPEVVSSEKVLGRYICNHTKMEYVDKSRIPDYDGWQLHPLPLLTCEGNGRGGGDYGNEGEHPLIGSWHRGIISIEPKKPFGYTEIDFNLPMY